MANREEAIEALDEARSEVNAAIEKYVTIRNSLAGLEEPGYIAAWVVVGEAISGELLKMGATQPILISKKDQLMSTNLGLMDIGKDYYSLHQTSR